MGRTTAPNYLRGLAETETSLAAALSEAVRPLRPALRRLKVHDELSAWEAEVGKKRLNFRRQFA